FQCPDCVELLVGDLAYAALADADADAEADLTGFTKVYDVVVADTVVDVVADAVVADTVVDVVVDAAVAGLTRSPMVSPYPGP
ncbi:hypothetical protein A2U01_0087035, partial [Trifolium medium]|nr:hypothetical protein [Trifolium medium]